MSRPRGEEILKKYKSESMVGFSIISSLDKLTAEGIEYVLCTWPGDYERLETDTIAKNENDLLKVQLDISGILTEADLMVAKIGEQMGRDKLKYKDKDSSDIHHDIAITIRRLRESSLTNLYISNVLVYYERPDLYLTQLSQLKNKDISDVFWENAAKN